MSWDRVDWSNIASVPPREFTCGFCARAVASAVGWPSSDGYQRIWICPNCTRPSYFYHDNPTPGVAPGNAVDSVPDKLHELYDEARRAVSVNSHTAAVLACRKLLMNIAVTQGAEENRSFLHYVEYLADNGFVPPNGTGWVDHIRKKGNEATHEIALMDVEDAVELIVFSEMLLKFIYEFPARVPTAPTPE